MKKHRQRPLEGGDELPFDPRPSDARPMTRQDVKEKKERRQSLIQDLRAVIDPFARLKPISISWRAEHDGVIACEVQKGEWD
ncbi:MAG: hypothetical protein WCG07_01050 [Candidatus Taylorbacteria bacterium]